jgi:hypothetical protein
MPESVFDRERRIRSSRLTMPQTFLLLCLNRHIGSNADAWPSQSFLADQMNASKRSVQKWTRQLEQMGVIHVQSGRGRLQTNRYRLRLDKLPQKPSRNSEQRAPLDEGNSEPRAPAMANDVRLNGERRAPRKNMKEQGKEHSCEFDQFWNAYRKKVGRRKAETAFAAAMKRCQKAEALTRQDAAERIITAASKYAAQFDDPNDRFKAHPATWLNGDHWDDDPAAVSQSAKRNGKPAAGSSEALAAWQAAQDALRTHSRFESDKIMAAVGERAWQALRPIGLKRLDESNDFERRELQTQFCRLYEQQQEAAA